MKVCASASVEYLAEAMDQIYDKSFICVCCGLISFAYTVMVIGLQALTSEFCQNILLKTNRDSQ